MSSKRSVGLSESGRLYCFEYYKQQSVGNDVVGCFADETLLQEPEFHYHLNGVVTEMAL